MVCVTVPAYTPLVRIPGIEPAGEGGWLVSLFHKDDGCVWVAARWMGPQIFLCTVPCLFGLILVGQVPHPQEDLRRTKEGCVDVSVDLEQVLLSCSVILFHHCILLFYRLAVLICPFLSFHASYSDLESVLMSFNFLTRFLEITFICLLRSFDGDEYHSSLTCSRCKLT